MKKLILVLCVSLFTLGLNAQEVQVDRTKLYKIQSNQIANQLKLDDKTREKFEQLYEQYSLATQETRRPKNRMAQGGDNRMAQGGANGMRGPAAKHREQEQASQMSDEMIEKRILDSYEMAIKSLEIKKEYYFKFKEILSPSQINEMYEVEQRIMNRLTEEKNRRGNPMMNGGSQGMPQRRATQQTPQD